MENRCWKESHPSEGFGEWRGDPFIYKTLTPVRDSAYERPDWKYN